MVRIRLIITAIVIMGALAVPGSPVHANGYTVTKTADTMDFVCNADCSLREAIYAANNVQGPHTIDLPGGGAIYRLTIPGAGEELGFTGDLDIMNEMEILGDENPIIEIDGVTLNDRVIQISGGNAVTIAGVTIRGGSTLGDGGGIYNEAALALYNSTVSDNHAVNHGGGIYNAGTLAVDSSTVTNNNGNYGYGGGIFSSGPLNLNSTTVSGNYGNYAGGIFIDGAATVNNGVIRGNTAGYYGGGIWIGNAGDAVLNNSTVRNNSAPNGGGGIFNDNGILVLNSSAISGNYSTTGGGLFNSGASGTASLTNTTISGQASFSFGGGIYNSGASLVLNSSTISSNSAYGGGGLYNYSSGTVSIRNTIVANSPSGGNCGGEAVYSSGFNLSSDATCAFNTSLDMINTNPALGPLAYNGGLTPTHALQDWSPAADAGHAACPAVDQRGTARPQGLRCDIGAFEAPDSDADGVSDPLDTDDDNDGLYDGSEIPSCRTLAEDPDLFQDSDGCPDPDNDEDDICDPGQTSLSCTGSDSGKRCFDPAGTLSCPTQDCRNAAEDADAFKDGDGCPEPDNDNDGKLDAADVCPGTDSLAGANGMLGSPQDLNHNGVRDAGAPWNEAVLTTDDSPLALAFEDYDGVLDADGCHDSPGADFDGDGLTDDNEVFTHLTDAGNPDTDADTVTDGTDNCPNWPNTPQNLPAWTIPGLDSDCDGFNVAREQWVGTDPTRHCNADSTANNEATDAWPSDFNDSRLTSLADVVLMGPVYNQATGTDPAKKRFDLNASGVVSLADVVLMGPFYNKSCG